MTGAAPWSARSRRSRALLISVNLLLGVLGPLSTTTGGQWGSGSPAIVFWAMGVAVVGLHLRNTFAVIGHRRPRWWPAGLAAIGVFAYVPWLWVYEAWSVTSMFFIASGALLLRGRARLAFLVVVLTCSIAVEDTDRLRRPHVAAGGLVADDYYWLVAFLVFPGCLYGVAMLVRTVDELIATRAELAEHLGELERLRLSRDLHDLLGQSLSALSLKGDLAAAVLDSDPAAAAAEIRSIAELARATMRDMRLVSIGEHGIALNAEVNGAVALLDAAGIRTTTRLEHGDLSPVVDSALAWALREGVTNVLRHSEAHICTITTGHRGGRAFLEIVNDGARAADGDGRGLAGIAERARELSGSVSALRDRDRFRLLLEIPRRPA